MNRVSQPRSHCLSPLVFDRLLAGEKDGLESALFHIEQCDSCRAHLNDLTSRRDESLEPQAVSAGVDAIMAAYEKAQTPDKTVRIDKHRKVFWTGLGLAVAAAVALILNVLGLLRTDSQHRDNLAASAEDGIRIKGSHVFQVLIVNQKKGRILRDQDTVEAGDVLAFRVTVTRPQYVSLASIGEQLNKGASFLDHGQTAPWKVVPGAATQLPVSAVLDEQPENERVFAFFCDRPGIPNGALQKLEQLYEDNGQRSRDLEPKRIPVVEKCDVKTLLLRRNKP